MSEDISKLPKWAQQHIENLGRRIQKLESDLAALSATSVEETDTWGDDYDNTFYPLPKGTRVMFRVGSGRQEVVSVRVENDGRSIDINGLSGRLVIYPRAANDIRVEMSR